MATEIGIIKELIGTATATSAEGTQRNLQVGDRIFADDIIATGTAGAVEIEFSDGSVMDLGRSSQALLDNEVFNPQTVTASQTDVEDDVAALQQALLDGTDPTQAGEATAAGADVIDGNEGNSSVTVDYLAPEAEVTSGFDTTGPSIAFLESVEEVSPTEALSEPTPNTIPTIEVPDTNGSATGENTVAENASITGETFTITAPDGLASLTVGGTVITAAQLAAVGTTPIAAIATTEGSITITGFNAVTGTVTYNYDPTGLSKDHSGAEVVDSIAILVTDTDGDSSAVPQNLDILITDTDVTAVADTGEVSEDVAADTTASGNVITGTGEATADTLGTDTPINVVGVVTTNTGADLESAVTVGADIIGTYGKINIAADGSYTYTLDNTDPDTQALLDGDVVTDVFTYTIKDADGDLSHTTVTITVNGADEGVPTVTIPDDNGSATGENSVVENTTITGETFSITAPDGLASLTVGGTVITAAQLAAVGTTPIAAIATTEGSLTITGFNAVTGTVTYNYDPTGLSKDHSGTEVVDSIAILVTDTDGDTSAVPQNLDILITDTDVTAVADTGEVSEDVAADTTASGNVITGTGEATADTLGTDTPINVVGVVTTNTGADLESAVTVGADIIGTYGKINIAADGSYTYTLDNTDPDTQALLDGDVVTDVFTYTIKDADGDLSHTTVTITVNGADEGVPTVTVPDDNGAATAGDNTVVENASLTGETFTITAPDGLASLTVGTTVFTAAQLAAATSGSPLTVTTTEGVLTITDYTTGTVTYNYDPAGTNKDHDANNDGIEDQILDSIALIVTDTDGDTSTANSLDILITDTDVTAVADTGEVSEDVAADTTASGNVITGTGEATADTLGTDTPINVVGVVTTNTGADLESAVTVGADIIGTYGKINIAADGSYTYTLDNTDPDTQALLDGDVVTDVFTYTIKDADGDLSHTTVTITVNGADEGVPTVTIPDDNGSATGENSVVENASITGETFTITAPDGLASLTVGTTVFTAAQLAAATSGSPLTVTTTEGVLTITDYTTGTVTYNYDPAGTNKDHDANNDGIEDQILDSIALIVTDTDGDTSTANSLDILITDTVPIANDDANTVDVGSSVGGNVITENDDVNVDGVSLVSVTYNGTVFDTFNGAGDLIVTTDNGELAIQADGSYVYTSSLIDSVGGTNGLTDWSDITFTAFNGARTVAADNEFLIDANFLPVENNILTINGTGVLSVVEDVFADGTDGIGIEEGAGNADYLNGHPTTPEAISFDLGRGVLSTDVSFYSGTNSGVDFHWVTYDSNGDFMDHGTGVVSKPTFTLHIENTDPTATFQYVVFYGVDNSASSKVLLTGIENIEYPTIDADTFTYTIRDGDNDESSADLVINQEQTIVTIVPPVAVDDSSVGNTLGDIVTFSLIGNDSDSDGSIDVTTVLLVGDTEANGDLIVLGEGTWSVSATGDITFTPEVGFVGDPTDVRYTVRDLDGNVSNVATVTVDYIQPPAFANSVSDDDDVFANTDVNSLNDISHTGTITSTLDVGTSYKLVGDTSLTSGGQALSYSWDGTTLTATADGSTIFTITLSADQASYTFKQFGPLDHEAGDGENDLTATFTAQIVDASDTVIISDTFNVVINDDIPNAVAVSNSGEAVQSVDTNLMLILDTSGSMGNSSGFQGMTRLEVMVKSSLELLEQYDAFGDVMVNLVTFSGSSTNPSNGWVDIATAKTLLLALNDGGATNYDAALNMAWNAFEVTGAIDGAQAVSYFMSDGAPNGNSITGTGTAHSPLGGVDGIDDAEETAWEGFLEANNIKSYAFGIGSGVSLTNLEPVSYDGSDGAELAAISVTDLLQRL